MTLKTGDLKKGDEVVVDDAFTCIAPGTTSLVWEDEGGLYLHCSHGHHYLDGQLNDDGEYVGLERK